MQHVHPEAIPPIPPGNSAEVLEAYRVLRWQHQTRSNTLRTHQLRTLIVLAAVILLIGWQTFASLHGSEPAWPMLLSFATVVILIFLQFSLQGKVAHTERLLTFYDLCMSRADGSEPYSDRTGENISPGLPHLYCRDLDITGPQSIFSLLATTRTAIGERGLAHLLLAPASHEEAVLRQQAVRELLPRTALRERIALLGASTFQQLSASFFDDWLTDIPPTFHPVIRYALLATTTITIALILAGIFRIRAWSDLFPNLLAVLGLQAAITLLIRKRILPLLEGGARLQGQVRLCSEGLALLEACTFSSPRLIHLQHLAREPADAVPALKSLDGTLTIIQQRTKEMFFVFSLLIAAGTQAAISLAAWKRRYAPAMHLWLTAWGEFEALNALATYAFEHPCDNVLYTWPQLLPPSASPQFNALSLGHSLLPSATRNSIALGGTDDGQPPTCRFLLISGSNMAGKSTLLRSIGTAAVLAYAGAPVPASSLRLSPLAVAACIALTDSLAEGKSKFLAEVERLAAIATLSSTQPVLFLVDEIFSGTNSLDRHTAAAAVLARLLRNHTIGALSTHDLALTSLASEHNGGLNVHMASPDPDDALAFDYKLKPGINQHTNALAIIRMLGL